MATQPFSAAGVVHDVSLDPKDYVWGPLSTATQQQMFAQFMSMTQMALMYGCALLPPPALVGVPPTPPSVGTAAAPGMPGAGALPPPPGAFPFWPPARPPLAAPMPVLPMPEKPCSPAPPATPMPATPRGSSCADLAAPTPMQQMVSKAPLPAPTPAPAAAPAPAATPSRAASCVSPKSKKKSGGSKSGSKATGSKTAQAAAAAAAAELAPSTPRGASLAHAASAPLPCAGAAAAGACDPDHDMRMLEVLPLDLDDIRDLFQDDLAQEIEQRDSLSCGASQGSHDTCFATSADAAIASFGAGSSPHTSAHTNQHAAPQGHALLNFEDPLSLASFDQTFDPMGADFKAIGQSFDGLHDFGAILDGPMDEDFATFVAEAAAAAGPMHGAHLAAPAPAPAPATTTPTKKDCGASPKALKVNRSRSSGAGVTKPKASDKARSASASATLVEAPLEELLGL